MFSNGDLLKAIQSLPNNKASPFDGNPPQVLKNSIHIYSGEVTIIFNESLIEGMFPDTLKIADVTSIFNKGMIMKWKTITQWLCSQSFQKWFKNYKRKINSISILIVSGIATAYKMLYWLWLKNGKQLSTKKLKWVLFLWI